ncbi:Imm1 family immunity protein [Lentzea sp. HUAS12]|uniref:Imm1 family immunity protein n=1 Tax=Lentzea sp. HUAS12 TaxID=2951806 RepID=UPI0020A20ACD|nr:Imm1 family immunity protein [Lentzea sp. HUAS12]USX49198.1 Imm1 family immunity protein [Lentzea sp. HUAS12]
MWGAEDSDEPLLIRTPEELDVLLERTGGVDHGDHGVLLEVLDAASPYRVVLNVGICLDRGALRYAGGEHTDGVYSKNPDSTAPASEVRLFYYMNNRRDFPANSLYPIDVVRRAILQFMESDGGLPAAVEWQQEPVSSSGTGQ